MNSTIVLHSSLEEQELARKREELAALEIELADRELFLANIRAKLTAFEGRYLREVGVLYAEFDEWKAKIAEFAAEAAGTEDAREAAAQARARAEESYAASHGEAASATDSHATPESEKLFKEIAKQIHPDLTDDEADRLLRTRLMAEANLARERGDIDALRRLLEEYRYSPESIRGKGAAADLQRILRVIKRIRQRLAEIETEIAELACSEIAMLMSKVQAATASGRDLLAEMANDIRQRIELAQREYSQMTRTANTK